MRHEVSYEHVYQAPCDSYSSLSFLQAIKWIVSGTTYRDVGEKISSPPQIAEVLKYKLKIGAKEKNKRNCP
jgi:hypothetical protein